LWHSLNENGEIKYYDVEWSSGNVETDIPAELLEGLAQNEHGGPDEGDINELHESHGVEGHKENALMSERRYKQRMYEKKKKPFPDLTGDGKVTKADILKGRGVDLDEKAKLTPYQKKKYKASGARGKSMAKTSKQYADAKKAGREPPKSMWDERERIEKAEREKPGYKTRKRSDSMKEGFKLTRAQLRRLIMETLEEVMLDGNTESYDEHDHIDEKLSKKTKATLRKKAKSRGLTPGSVEAEYKKGLAAWGSSGSRKGMSQHQWAMARVNSAQPSKSWAVVKKSKKK
jgi:hypothetical protein